MNVRPFFPCGATSTSPRSESDQSRPNGTLYTKHAAPKGGFVFGVSNGCSRSIPNDQKKLDFFDPALLPWRRLRARNTARCLANKGRLKSS